LERIKQNEQELLAGFDNRVVIRDEHEPVTEDEKEEEQQERMRIEVINEVLISERYYVRDLETIINVFLRPLKGEVNPLDLNGVSPPKSSLLAPEETNQLFSNIELILRVNQEILNNLFQDFENAGNIQLMNIGAVFLGMVDYLKIYSIYSTHQMNAIQLYNRLKKENKQFSQFLQETERKNECKGVNLLGFLIKPIQRICKYPLLFKELLKNTSPDHIDYPNIENCLKKLTEVAEYVNEMKRSSESIAKMVEIQENLTDTPKGFTVVAPARQFIREGSFVKINAHGKAQERHIFLFNDILVYVKAQFYKRGATYQFKGSIPMDCCLINDIPDNEALQNAFELIRMDSNKKKYLLSAATAPEKSLWVKDLNRIIDAHLEKLRQKTHRNSQP